MSLVEDILPDCHTGDASHIEVTIVPGDEVNHTSLLFSEHGRHDWELSMYYGYHFNGNDVPIAESQAVDIIENIAGHDFREDDLSVHDWFYAECDECPCEDCD